MQITVIDHAFKANGMSIEDRINLALSVLHRHHLLED